MADEAASRARTRQELTATTFVELVDTLVDDFDVIDVLTVLTARSVELLGASAAGILLADESGQLRVMAASSEAVQLLELFQIQNEEGPCLDCYASGATVIDNDLGAGSAWPMFAEESLRNGFRSVCAVPLRLKDMILGCLNLFIAEPGGLADTDLAVARALADVASIAIVQDQVVRRSTIREGQLQHALDSRIAIEQAKGIIAERGGVDMDEAFDRLRSHSRRNNLGLTRTAIAVVEGSVRL